MIYKEEEDDKEKREKSERNSWREKGEWYRLIGEREIIKILKGAVEKSRSEMKWERK